MQPGYPGSGQDPYGQQPPYVDPYAQPQYPPQSQEPQQSQQSQPEEGQPPTGDPYGQPPQAPQYQDPYAQPTSGGAYPPPGPGYPGAAPYPMAGYGTPPQQNNTLGLVGMIIGIVSIPLACCPLIGFFAGVAGIVLGILGMKKASAGEASNRGQALTGVICGAVSIVLSIGWFIASLALNLGNFSTAP
jgi:hypothetical protein